MALSSFLNVNGYDFPPPRRGFSWTITTTVNGGRNENKYYIENELVYLCKRGGVLNPESMYGQKEKLYFKPSALIGQYFEIA